MSEYRNLTRQVRRIMRLAKEGIDDIVTTDVDEDEREDLDFKIRELEFKLNEIQKISASILSVYEDAEDKAINDNDLESL